MSRFNRYFRRLRRQLWQNIYIYCLLAIVIVHVAVIIVLDALNLSHDFDTSPTHMEYALILIVVSIEWLLIIFQCKILHKFIFVTEIKPILCLYLNKIIAFSDIYVLLFKMQESQFHVPAELSMNRYSSYAQLTFSFINYSISCQTLTGISSIAPQKIWAEFLTAFQVLFFGLGYAIFILSIAIMRFTQIEMDAGAAADGERIDAIDLRDAEYLGDDTYIKSLTKSIRSRSKLNHIVLSNPGTASSPFVARQYNDLIDPDDDMDVHDDDDAVVGAKLHSSFRHTSIQQIVRRHPWMRFVKQIYDHLLLYLFVIQTPRLLVMFFYCKTADCDSHVLLYIGIFLDVMSLIFCLFCVIIRMSLIRTLEHRSRSVNTSILGLVAAYFTILILFGLLYFDVWIATKNTHFPAFSVNRSSTNDMHAYWSMLAHFVFFSTSAFTNVGTEIVIQCDAALGHVLNGFQMLIGVVFHTVVFGVALLKLGEQRVIQTDRIVRDIVNEEKKKSFMRLRRPIQGRMNRGNINGGPGQWQAGPKVALIEEDDHEASLSQSAVNMADVHSDAYNNIQHRSHQLRKQGLLARQSSRALLLLARQQTKPPPRSPNSLSST